MIVSEPDGTIGGADMHVLELAAAQQEAAAVVPVVLAPRASAEFRRRARALGVRVVTPRGLGLHGLWRLGRSCDIVHAHGYDADFWWVALRASPAWRPAAAVVTAHGFVETGWRLRALTRLDIAAIRATADACIACSADVAERLRDAGVTAPIFRIENGVAAPAPADARSAARVREAAGAADGAPLVAFVGRLAREKRPDVFVRAAALIAETHPGCRFVVCGAGPERDRVRALALRAGLADALALLGFMRAIAPVLAVADVLVSTSDSESTPRMLAEAMRRGVAVVATSVGGVAEVVEHGVSGLLAPPRSPAATAAHVCRLLDDRGLARALAETGRARADGELCIKRMERRVREVYAAALERSQRTVRSDAAAARCSPGAPAA